METVSPEIFNIHLPQFEGPFDLLLFFIERDELDIYDIPIATITQEFLAYVQMMETMNMEMAAEFILMAGTLMRIKAKMLLPRKELDEKGVEIDPREELIARLLAYKKYKSVVEDLAEMEWEQSLKHARGNVLEEQKNVSKVETPIEDLSSMDGYTLMRIFKNVWDKHQHDLQKPRHVIRQFPYNIDDVRKSVAAAAAQQEKVDFVAFIMQYPDKMYCVFSFLAILELVQEKVIRVSVGVDFNAFWFLKRETDKE